MKRLAILLTLTFVSLVTDAQLINKIKGKVTNVVKDGGTLANKLEDKAEEKGKALLNKVQNNLREARAEFDSTDFDYAILVSDNSGLTDLKEKGERKSKFYTTLNFATAFAAEDTAKTSDAARMQLDFGEYAYAMRKYTIAERFYLSSKEKYERIKYEGDIAYIKVIANMGLLYSVTGRFSQAETFSSSALNMRKEKLGPESPGVASSLNNYGVLHYNVANYNEGEADLAQALKILEKNQLQSSMQYAIVLNNQAMLYQAVGRYDESVTLLKKAMGVSEALGQTDTPNHRRFLSNLALLYQQMGKYPEAEAVYLKMDFGRSKNNPDYASMLNNLAALYLLMGQDEKVEDNLKKSIAIYKSNFGDDNPATAKATSDLGNFYRYKARYSDAEPLLVKALSVREKTLGPNHPHYVKSKEDLAILYWKKADWANAYSTYNEAMTKSIEFIDRYFGPMSEAEKTKYWDVLYPRFQRFNNFAIECSTNNPQTIDDLYNYQIATKALLLSSTNKVKEAILSSKNKALIKDYLTWLDQKEQLARLYSYSKEELSDQKINLDSLENSANTMERKLSSESSEFSSGYASIKTLYRDIQKLLTDTEALVSIVRVAKFDQRFTEDVRYAALILTKTTGQPQLIVLDNGQQLETRYAKFYRNAIHQKITDEYSYDQFWAPLEESLTGKKLIYLSPDGVYNQINLNTLRRGTGDYFINRFDLVILGNSKDLVSIKKRKAVTAKKSATLIGFPDYGGTQVAALPGTKVELDGIGRVLKGSGYQVSSFIQKSATEANIKNVKGPVVLHIATHGYFLADVSRTEGSAFGIHMENAGDNPLLRSGLLLAGASKTAAGSMPNLKSNDNGVLTAYEAMNLNLEGTNLVIMSACETGLGDVKSGEGVYGLQRAFLVAGADAIVMSLWKVDDAATQALMTNFYTNWVKLRDKQKAFKQAQVQLMAKFKEPYYWGAFVMMGL